jgi:hypothetical protein
MKQIASLTLCLIFLISITSVFAQSNQTDLQKNTSKVSSRIKSLGTGDSAKLKVKLYNGSKYEGSVKSSADTEFVLIERSGTERTISYSDVKSVGGTGLSKGAKIGIGVGAAAGGTLLVLYLVFKHITRNN